MIPLFVGHNAPTGNYTAVVEIVGQDSAGRKLQNCFSTKVHVGERKVFGCSSACGTILAYTPGGNPAKSNGQDQGTGDSCAGLGQWGYQYQCVELVQRSTQSWFNVAYAKQMCDSHPSNFYPISDPGPRDIYGTRSISYSPQNVRHRQIKREKETYNISRSRII
jgi:hypothetical protein